MPQLNTIWACPSCKIDLELSGDDLLCSSCREVYEHIGYIPKLIKKEGLSENETHQHTIYESYEVAFLDPARQYNNFISLSTWHIFDGFKQLNLKRNDKVLEVGCLNSNKLITLGLLYKIKPFGIDLSQSALQEQGKMAQQFNLDGSFAVANASSLPCRDNCFDAVILLDIIEHVEDKRGLLNQCHRCLKEGGRLFIKAPAEKDDNIFSFTTLSNMLGAKWVSKRRKQVGHLPELALSKVELKSLINMSGFKILKWKARGIFLDVVWDLFIADKLSKLYLKIALKKKAEPVVSKKGALAKPILKRNTLSKLVLLIGRLMCLPDIVISWFGVGTVIYIVAEKNA